MNTFPVIDAHAHIFPEKLAAKAIKNIGSYYGIAMRGGGTAQDLLRIGKSVGIHKFVVHSTATKVDQVRSINDFISDATDACPDFIGLGTLHPDMPDLPGEVEYIRSRGLLGVKLHPEFQEFIVDDPGVYPLYAAIEGRLPLLIHMGDENKDSSSPRRLAHVLQKFPGLRVIAAHFGGYQMWSESEQYLVGENVYFDTSSSLSYLGPTRAVEIIRRHGPEKVLFGSDYPMWSLEEELARFMALPLTEYERQLILWQNASRLFEVTE